MSGGALVAETLQRHGVHFLFTLCGGHISPILVEAKRRGIRVVDTRHEATAVFAADAVARLTGVPGVAAVTAGPGVTNSVTALENARLAQSPVVLLGGATATVLKGRGALQDIDQMAVVRPHVKHAASVRRARHLPGALEEAFFIAREGVPGPVFVECPVDLLYPPEVVEGWYGAKSGADGGGGLGQRLQGAYLRWHARRLFAGAEKARSAEPRPAQPMLPEAGEVRRTASRLARAQRPLLLVGSQALAEAGDVAELAHAVEALGVPAYLSGMARGLLGRSHPLLMRHQRRRALKEADLVILAGVPADFRLDYGRHLPAKAFLVSANRSMEELFKNRRPHLAVQADPGRFLRLLAHSVPSEKGRWGAWLEELRDRDAVRGEEIRELAATPTEKGVNPLHLCLEIDAAVAEDAVLVADGGDFVATASYAVAARGPLAWLDPGPFGTLGVGAGFALGAKLARPDAEVWILYGDGSVGYSLAEVDTFVRHELPVIAVVGNDACWMQIAREQVAVLGDDVACVLRRTDYHRAAQGFGGEGILVRQPDEVPGALAQARQLASQGRPVLINAHIGATEFRKGSISI
jgi:acetolactate synthase-like protein